MPSQRGLKTNLGIILSGAQAAAARGERLSQLQSLLPSVDFSGRETVMQADLPAEGLRIPGFPTIIGPFGFTDVRASLSWSLVDIHSLRNYLAARHNFAAAQLSAEDARELVILTVGNAYLLVLADETRVASVEAQVATAKVSLDQAAANHQAGTAPLLDELRARVDYQSLEQQLIVARNALEKDKLALARAIGLPLAQSFNLTDRAPYAAFDQLDVEAAIRQAHLNRKDLAAMVEQAKAAEEARKAATAERLPTLRFDGDYGDIGTTLAHSHGTGDATGTLAVPLFKEFALRGEAQAAQAQLDTQRAAVERQERAGGRRCSRRPAGHCFGAAAGPGSPIQRRSGQRGSQRGPAALCQRRQRQSGGQSGRAVRGPGQRSICDQPLPAQCGQAQPGPRPGSGRELQELSGRKVNVADFTPTPAPTRGGRGD